MKVLITGHKGRLGKLLVDHLQQKKKYQLIGLDRRIEIPNPPDFPCYNFSPNQKRVEQIFHDHSPQAIIHLNILHDPRKSREDHHLFNILGTSNLLEIAANCAVKKFIFLSSADVYGARPENSQFLTEESPLMGATHNDGLSDLIQTDYQVCSSFWKYPAMSTVILRPSHIIGPVQNAATRYLSMPYPMTLLGFSPMVQFIHYKDLLDSLERGLSDQVTGIFNITSPAIISLRKLLKRLGRKTIPIPEFLARQALEVLWQTHFSSFPTPELNFLKYSCMIDDSRFRSLFPDYQRHNLESILTLLNQIDGTGLRSNQRP